MNLKELKSELSSLIGQTISAKKLANEIILIYFNGQPGEDNTKAIMLNPGWQYKVNNEIKATDKDYPWEFHYKPEYQQKFKEYDEKTNNLNLATLEKISWIKNNISLHFSGAQELECLDSEKRGQEMWEYSNLANNLMVTVYKSKIETETYQ